MTDRGLMPLARPVKIFYLPIDNTPKKCYNLLRKRGKEYV